MKHRGYTGSVEYDADERIFHGSVDGITDVVAFQGDSVEALEADFRAAVDEYVDFCAEQGVEPQRPCSGRFVLRVPPEMHRAAARAARDAHESLNTWIKGAVEARLAAGERRTARPRRAAQSAA